MSPAAARWSQIVDRSHRSPLTIREFARREGVNPKTLSWWRWKLKGHPEGSSRFVELEVVSPEPPVDDLHAWGGLVVQVGAARVEVDASSDL